MIDLEYGPTTFAGPVDWRVVRFIESYRKHKFDLAYLEHIELFHGGIPGTQYFDAGDGKTYRVGRFLTLVDEKTDLQPPFRPSWEFPQRDIRIDWSVLTHIDEEGPNCMCLFGGEVLWPFARLFWRDQHPDGMGITEAGVVDLLSFLYESDDQRPRIVVWSALRAFNEYEKWESAGCGEVRYAGFTLSVAPHFEAFLQMLRKQP